jgi:hypothetical protein
MTTTIPNRAIPRGPYAAHAERARREDEEADETPAQRASREADEEQLRREHVAREYAEEADLCPVAVSL